MLSHMSGRLDPVDMSTYKYLLYSYTKWFKEQVVMRAVLRLLVTQHVQ